MPVDMKTEVGSQYGEGEDQELEGEEDTITLPSHTDIDCSSSHSIYEQQRDLAKDMAEHLVQAALLAGSRNNITVMVILLPGTKL